MWNKPTKQELGTLPFLYSTEETPLEQKLIHMHFFIAGCDWYAAEFDGQDTFFGFAIINGDLQNAEWGYFSLSELSSLSLGGIQVDRDLYWKIRPAIEVDKIREAHA